MGDDDCRQAGPFKVMGSRGAGSAADLGHRARGDVDRVGRACTALRALARPPACRWRYSHRRTISGNIAHQSLARAIIATVRIRIDPLQRRRSRPASHRDDGLAE
jgi:hypothetical protein